MNYYCIADEDTVRGFRLAGVKGHVANTPGDASSALRKVITQPDIGIIIMTGPVADGIRKDVETLRLEQRIPLIVEIPGPGDASPGRRSLRETARTSIGIPIGLEERH